MTQTLIETESPRTLSRRQQRAADASAQSARALFREVCTSGTEPARTSTASLTVAAGAVHLITLAMIGVGVGLLAGGFAVTAPVRFGFGAIAVILGLYLQPFQPAPKNRRKWAQPLTRDIAPILFGVIDDIAHGLDAPGVDSVYFNTRRTSSLVKRSTTGWTLTLGLALWSALSPDERVALIAHEVSHQVNHDQRRSWLVRTATDAQGRWARLLRPRLEPPALVMLARVLGTVGWVAMLPFSLAARGLTELMSNLATRQGQAAEYFADQLSVTVAGSDSVQRLLEKSELGAIYDRELTRAVRFRAPLCPWSELSRFAANLPEAEAERHRRVGRPRLTAVDETHPPTQLRADVIAGQPVAEATVTLTGGRLQAVDAEIEAIKADATAVMRAALTGADAFSRRSLQA